MKRIRSAIGIIAIIILLFNKANLFAQCGNPFLIGQAHSEEAFRLKVKNLFTESQNNSSFKTAENRDTIYIPVVFNMLFQDSISERFLLEQYRFEQAIDSANVYLNISVEKVINMNIPEFSDIIDVPIIKLIIAKVDPQGNPTDGFRYRRWDAPNSNLFCEFPYLTGQEKAKLQSKGGITAWNQRYYLNFWVGNFRRFSGDCFSGQSTYPTYPFMQGEPLSFMDGILLQSYLFESRNYQDRNYFSTIVHEVGHYLGLLHIWGGLIDDSQEGCNIDDNIDDTPNQFGAHYDCSLTENTCTDPVNDKRDMCTNVMDYADGITFTKGQVSMMRSVLVGARKSLPIEKMSATLNISSITPCLGEVITLEWIPDNNYRFLFPSWDIVGKSLTHSLTVTKDTTLEISITQGYDTLMKSVEIKLQTPATIQVNVADTASVGDTLSIHFMNVQDYSTELQHTYQDSMIHWIVSTEVDSFWIFFGNKCFSDSALVSYTVKEETATGIFNNKKIEEVLVYPNPSNDFINVQFANQSESTPIPIYNSENRLVKKVYGNRFSISQLPYGNYFFIIEEAESIYLGKFVKQ